MQNAWEMQTSSIHHHDKFNSHAKRLILPQMKRDHFFASAVVAIFLMLLSLSSGEILSGSVNTAAVPVACLVGPNSTYLTIQDGLDNCNGGMGAIVLQLENWTFVENITVGAGLDYVEMEPQIPMNVPQPYYENTTARIASVGIKVLNPWTAFKFRGLAIDGMRQNVSLFHPRLTNNNVTLEQCYLREFRGNSCISIEACEEQVMITVRNTRFERVWGSAIHIQGMESYIIENVTLGRVGGYNNRSALYLKMSWVSRGVAIVKDVTHYLLYNKRALCETIYDPYSMVICRNGTARCYSRWQTELAGSCQLINITVVNETDSSSNFTVQDYDPTCRVYLPCTCAPVQFVNDQTNLVETYYVGDVYYYTGLRLPCVVINDQGGPPVNVNGNYTLLGSLQGVSPASLEIPTNEIGDPPPVNETGWGLGVIAIRTGIFVPPKLPIINETCTNDTSTNFTQVCENVTVGFMLQNQFNNSQLNMTTLELSTNSSCFCNFTDLPPPPLLCDYDIPIEQKTNIGLYNLTVPNGTFGIRCNESVTLCCTDAVCNNYTQCACPIQPDFTSNAFYNQTGEYNQTSLDPILQLIYSQSIAYAIADMPSRSDLDIMIYNSLYSSPPPSNTPSNHTIQLQDLWPVLLLIFNADQDCLVSGTCPLPKVGEWTTRINLFCEQSNKTLQCPCDELSLIKMLIPYDVSNFTAGLEIDNIPDNASSVVITNNIFQQLPFGAIINRVTHAKIVNTTTLEPYYFDELAVLREIYRQDNYFNGTQHDMAYGGRNGNETLGTRRFCDRLCPMKFTDQSEFVCIVDNSAGQPLPNSTYLTVGDAEDAGCKSVLLVGTENFYTENIVFGGGIEHLYSTSDAVIVGTHEIRTDKLDFRGVTYFHPGDEAVPLFTRYTSMEYLWFRNCWLDGGGVRGAGILNRAEENFIGSLVFNYTHISNWNFITVSVKDILQFHVHYTWIENTIGNSLDVEYVLEFQQTETYLQNVRGGKGLRGVPLFRYKSQNGDSSCTLESGALCKFINNIQDVDITAEDHFDICYQFIGGTLPLDLLRGNKCVKARAGMSFRDVSNVRFDTLAPVIINNPMIRPSNFPNSFVLNRIALNTGRVGVSNNGILNRFFRAVGIADFVLDIYYYSTFSGGYYKAARNFQCNFPCIAVLGQEVEQKTCEVNMNYDNDQVDQYGYETFHNFTDVGYYCRVSTDPNAFSLEISANATGWGGGRLGVDQIEALFPMQLHSIVADKELADPDLMPHGSCYPRFVVYGTGHQLIAESWYAEDIEWRVRDPVFGAHMFTTLAEDFPVYNVTFKRCTFDAMNRTAKSFSRALNLVMGKDFSKEEAETEEGPRRIKTKFVKDQSVLLDGCIFRNFNTYQQTVVDEDDPTGLSLVNVSAVDFPYTDPVYIEFLNVVGCNTEAQVLNTIFQDVDRTALDIRYADITTVYNTSFANCSGRIPNVMSCVSIAGNKFQPGSMINFTFNNHTQDKEVLFPTTSQIRTVWAAAYWFKNLPLDGVWYVRNNTANGLPIGMRISGIEKFTLVQNLDPANLPRFLDSVDEIRRNCYQGNEGINGTIYDIYYGEPYQDFSGPFDYCNECCLPPPPLQCSVSLTNVTHRSHHPYFGTHLFDNIPAARANCQAVTQQIRVDPNTPFTPYVLTVNDLLPLTHFSCNNSLSNSTNGTVHFIGSGPIGMGVNDYSGPPAEIHGCAHTLDDCRLRMEKFVFKRSSCFVPGAPIWNQTTTLDPPTAIRLELVNNTFDGMGSNFLAIGGVMDNETLIKNNRFINHNGIEIVEIQGRNCSTNFTIEGNYWREAIGTALNVSIFGGIRVLKNKCELCGCRTTDRNAVFRIAICMPNGTTNHKLIIHDNEVTQDANVYPIITTPVLEGGYCSAYWIDPVPDDLMHVEIWRNGGSGFPACLRLNNMPDDSPLTDPKKKLRRIANNDGNVICEATSRYWIVNAHPTFDTTIDSNPDRWRGKFCTDGCPITNGLIVGFLAVIPLSFIFCFIMYVVCCRPKPYQARTYYSATMQRPVYTDGERLNGVYGIDEDKIIAQQIALDRAQRRADAQAAAREMSDL